LDLESNVKAILSPWKEERFDPVVQDNKHQVGRGEDTLQYIFHRICAQVPWR
jgi:hypothetical protein